MAWVTTGGSVTAGAIVGLDAYKVIVSAGAYFETRTDPDDEDVTQVRAHTTESAEFRGLDYTHAASLSGAYISGLKTITRTLAPIGGGGYTITQTTDEMPSDAWTSMVGA
jgi:hypothetical protein